jgi:hypothetical protein
VHAGVPNWIRKQPDIDAFIELTIAIAINVKGAIGNLQQIAWIGLDQVERRVPEGIEVLYIVGGQE